MERIVIQLRGAAAPCHPLSYAYVNLYLFSFRIQSRLYPLLQPLVSCPVFTVRKLAASSLALFMPTNIAMTFIEKWTKDARHPGHNFNHGFLLFVKQLLEIKLDDARVLKDSDIDVVLEVSTTVLHTDNQPFMYCTLLEIYQILIPLLYKSNDKKSLVCRGKFLLHSFSTLPTQIPDIANFIHLGNS